METTPRVREILSWYPSANPGTLPNLYPLLMHGRWAGTGKLVILRVDQGFEHGPARSFAPNPPGYDPDYHIQLAIDSGCNAYAAPLGFIEAVAGKHAGQIPLILKLNNSDTLSKGHSAESAVTGSVKDAVRLGCVAIGYTIYPGSAPPNQDRWCSRRSQGARPRGRDLVVSARRRHHRQERRDRRGRRRLRGADRLPARLTRRQGEATGRFHLSARSAEGLREVQHPLEDARRPGAARGAELLQRQAHRHLLWRRGEEHRGDPERGPGTARWWGVRFDHGPQRVPPPARGS